MLDFLFSVASEIAVVFYEGSFYILIGFVIAGLLSELVPDRLVARHLGGNNFRSVAIAALFGAPLPLCSCSVLPAAAGLRLPPRKSAEVRPVSHDPPNTTIDSTVMAAIRTTLMMTMSMM